MGAGDHAALEAELDWLAALLPAAVEGHLTGRPELAAPLREAPPAAPAASGGAYGALIAAHGLEAPQRLALGLGLLPHLRPDVLDPLHITDQATGQRFTRFGGTTEAGRPLVATVETLAFLLGHWGIPERVALAAMFAETAPLIARRLLVLGPPADGALFASALLPGPALLEVLGDPGRGVLRPPADLPAQPLTTRLTWEDLVLDAATAAALEQVLRWLRLGREIDALHGPGRLVGQGFRALFHGPPGTGKTLAAALLGQRTGRAVWRADLSQIASKWIGETEKNLARLFDAAERQGWILFFDEADALFSQRTEARSSNDRFANQEVAYILQRMETFEGTVLLATNLRGNLDAAFTRRFQSVVAFSDPDAEARLRIWQRAFAPGAQGAGGGWLAPGADLPRLAARFELTGAAIVNCLRDALLTALSEGRRQLTQEDLEAAARREVLKSDRVVERLA